MLNSVPDKVKQVIGIKLADDDKDFQNLSTQNIGVSIVSIFENEFILFIFHVLHVVGNLSRLNKPVNKVG